MNSPIRILILDDHSLFREGLARLLDSEDGLKVAGNCASAVEALDAIRSTEVDVVLLDFDLGSVTATDFLNSLSELKAVPRILIVTAGMTEKAKSEALAAGVSGIVLKHSNPQHLIAAIRKAAEDLLSASRRLHFDAPAGDDEQAPDSFCDRPLTRRQASALRGILDGLGNREIGERMSLSESSVKAIIQELFHKAGVRTRSQLVRVAIEKHSSDWIR
jgi:two-component system, NarL family, nitrate/nitrite response regulator NarL